MHKKAISRMMLALLLVSMLTLAFNIEPAKTDPSDPPAIEWSKTYGGTSWDEAWSVVETVDGGYAIAGYTWSFGAGNQDFWLIKLAGPEISATVNINPATLNLKSRAKWITAYIELPEGYNVGDVDISTVRLNGEIAAELHPTEIGDYDEDGIPDLMVKFDRAEVKALLTVGEATLTITGEVSGIPFEGKDTIRVVDG